MKLLRLCQLIMTLEDEIDISRGDMIVRENNVH